MEQWTIFSNVVNYVQYDRNPREFYNLDVKAIDQKNHQKIYDRLKEIDKTGYRVRFWWILSDKLKEYLDMYDGHVCCM